jgi:hypothetical protein
MKLPMARMTEMRLPKLRVVRHQEAMAGARGVFIGDDAQRIELAHGVTSEQSHPRSEILD